MCPDSINSKGHAAKPKKYPIKHKRPVGRIIQRAPNRFLVWIHSHTDSSGQKKRYTKMWSTLKEADADLARVVAQRNRGKGVVDTNETLRAFIERFLSEAHAPRVKSYVNGKVTRAFKAWVFPFIGYKKVRSITPADVQNLYTTLRGRISPRTNAPLSEATIQRVHVHLRMALNWGLKTGELSRHPMENVTVRKPPRQKMVTFSEQQIRLFFQKWEEYQAEHPLRIPYGCIFHVAYETGMRPEEYLGLQFSDLHLDDDLPHIRVQRVAIRDIAKGGWWFDEPKTKGSVRNIPISRELAQMLRLQRLTVENYKRLRAEAWRENDLVFPNQKGEPIYQYLLTDLFREIVRGIGLDPKKYRLYTWRHSMATLAIANKVNVKAVSERLGHADISRTLETYTHVLPSMQLEAVEALGAIAYKRDTETRIINAQAAEGDATRPC
ncbi:MAG TPA: tyrosine-type recombinase/integrase [Pyrinomonadaceae bacterium]|nr:tyrosine-type recombinase/integrase [Pyrinomonadaceae bacterium]